MNKYEVGCERSKEFIGVYYAESEPEAIEQANIDICNYEGNLNLKSPRKLIANKVN